MVRRYNECAAGAASLREIAFSLKNPFARWAATSSARSLSDFTLERPLPGPYAPLTAASSNAGSLTLDSVRPRSLLPRVCRNLSCKLLSHALAALPRRSKTKTGPDRAMRRTAAKTCLLATVCCYANCSHMRSRPCHGVVKRRRARTCAMRRTAASSCLLATVCRYAIYPANCSHMRSRPCHGVVKRRRAQTCAVRLTAARSCPLATVLQQFLFLLF